MKKLFVLMTPVAVLLGACEPVDDSDTQTSAPEAAGAYYAARPTQYNWPAAEHALALAPSLLTPNYYLVIDGSGSMEDAGCSGERPKLEVAKEAVAQFVDHIPEDANVGLLVFDDAGIAERVALGANHTAVKQYVLNMQASGGTPLRSAMSLAFDAITVQAQKQLGYGEYHMVVVTDGEANGGEDPRDLVRAILAASPVTIHTIGFCIGSGHSLNIPGVTDYRAANNPAELLAGLQSVLAESPDYVADQFDAGSAKE